MDSMQGDSIIYYSTIVINFAAAEKKKSAAVRYTDFTWAFKNI